MTTLNSNTVVDRHNRPNTVQAVLLRAFFVNDGVYTDPVDISGVTVFNASSHFNPSSILDADGLIDKTNVSAAVLMEYGTTATPANPESGYNPDTDVSSLSGVYQLGTGEFAVVMDGSRNLSGNMHVNVPSVGEQTAVINAASAAGDYIDAWTVKLAAASNYKTIINNFTLKDDTFFTITQPILFTAREKLSQKKVTLDSIIDLKAFIDVSVQNRDLDEATKNIFCRSVITSGAFSIDKLNDSPGLDSRVAVSGFADTSSVIDITSDNTMIFNWNTSLLPAIAAANNNYGGVKGTYEVRVQYSILNQTLISPPLYITVV